MPISGIAKFMSQLFEINTSLPPFHISPNTILTFSHLYSSGGNGLPCKFSKILLLKGHQLVMNISCVY